MKEFTHVNKIHNFSNTVKVSDALKEAAFADGHNHYSERWITFWVTRAQIITTSQIIVKVIPLSDSLLCIRFLY